MIDRFVSITTSSSLLFRCILSILALTYLIPIALFCTTIRRDSISHAKFTVLSHVQVFSCENSLVCRYSCFSSHFCFLVIFVLLMLVLSVLFLVTVISLPLRFLCILRVVVSVHWRYLLCRYPLFLTNAVSIRHLWNVRPYVWWVFLFSGSFVEVFPSSRDFCNLIWFRVVFSFSWDTFFLIFFSISTCLMVSTSNILKYL